MCTDHANIYRHRRSSSEQSSDATAYQSPAEKERLTSFYDQHPGAHHRSAEHSRRRLSPQAFYSARTAASPLSGASDNQDYLGWRRPGSSSNVLFDQQQLEHRRHVLHHLIVLVVVVRPAAEQLDLLLLLQVLVAVVRAAAPRWVEPQ